MFIQFIITVSPFLPFETEVLWQKFLAQKTTLSLQLKDITWLKTLWDQQPLASQLAEEFASIISFVDSLRSTRGLFAIDPSRFIEIQSDSELLNKYRDFVKLMVRAEIVPVRQEKLYWVDSPNYSYGLSIFNYIIDPNTELARTKKIILDLEKQTQALQQQLANPNFLNSASPEIIAEKQNQLQQRQTELNQQLNKLDFLESS